MDLISSSGHDLNSRPPPLAEIAIVTSNRSAFLRRCVASYARHCEEVGRQCRFTVFDDTESLANRQASREWLIEFGRQYRKPVRYVDLTSKKEFVGYMQAAGISRSILEFALGGRPVMGVSPGRNRNAALMHFADCIFFCSDDDAICRPSDFRSGGQALQVLTRGTLSLDTHFFPNRRAAFKASPAETCDILGAHEALLGRPFEQLPWSSAGIALRQGLVRRPDKGPLVSGAIEMVAVTVSGVVGDSGIPNNLGFMVAEGAIRERFLAAVRRKGNTLISRNIVRGVCRPSVTDSGLVFTTTGTGFDNRKLLPPFLPSGSGEDTLFGVLMGLCNPNSYSAHVPVGLAHDPSLERTYAEPPAVPTMARLLMALLYNCALHPQQTQEQRMRALGYHLQTTAANDLVVFGKIITTATSQITLQWIEVGKSHLILHGNEPRAWAEAMERWLSRLRHVIDNPYADEEKLRSLRQYVLDYGLLLQAWPDIIAAARDLRSRGCYMAPRLRFSL